MEPKDKKVMGLCALCGPETREAVVLRQSHFLPKAVYRYFNRFKSDGTKLLLRTQEDEKVLSMGKQVVQSLLCGACEGLMSAEGEDYYLSAMLKINVEEKVNSPVYQILWSSLVPVWSAHRRSCGSGLVLSVGANFFPAIKSRRLYHYVIGMFWKATFEGWEYCPAMPLDSSVIEEMRKFLRGGAFLQDYIVRIVPSFERAKFGVVFPTLVQGQPFFSVQQFDFYLEKDERQFRLAASMAAVPLLYTIDSVRSERAYQGAVASYIKTEKTSSAANTRLSWLGD